MKADDVKPARYLQREAQLLSLAGPQPQSASPVCMPKIFLAPIENQADRPECPKVKITHFADFKNTDKQTGDLSWRTQTLLPLCSSKGEDKESERWYHSISTFLVKKKKKKPDLCKEDIKGYLKKMKWNGKNIESSPSYLQSGGEGHRARPLLDLHEPSLDFFSESWNSPSLFTTTQKQ